MDVCVCFVRVRAALCVCVLYVSECVCTTVLVKYITLRAWADALCSMGIARIIDDDKDILYETVNPLVGTLNCLCVCVCVPEGVRPC